MSLQITSSVLRCFRSVVVLVITSTPAFSQSNELISVTPSGGVANNLSSWSSISGDGRFVAFASLATNIDPAVVFTATYDVYVRDRLTMSTKRLSVGLGGAQGNGDSEAPSISLDGQFIAFGSTASNLVPGDQNARADMFVCNRLTGALEMISVTPSGAPGNATTDSYASLSADGNLIAFYSVASDLVSNDVNGVMDVFVRDRALGVTERVSVSSSGAQGSGDSGLCSISSDGRFVAFESSSTNLVAGDTNGFRDVFVRDRQLGTTTRISSNPSGKQGNQVSGFPSISGDGRFVAYQSDATNLVVGDTTIWPDIFVFDRQLSTTRRVNLTSWGEQATNNSFNPKISADGRFVVFESAGNLVADQTQFQVEIYICEIQTMAVDRVSMSWNEMDLPLGCYKPAVSADGRYVSFQSSANQIVPFDTQTITDIVVRDRGISQITMNCFGDGSASACPCGNAGADNRGCGNSYTTEGARLVATGHASIALDSVVLAATGLPNTLAVFFQGINAPGAGSGVDFGDGLLCARGFSNRLATKAVVSNYSFAGRAFPNDRRLSELGSLPASGGLYHYQVWYRDLDPVFCSPAVFNLTNGLDILWKP